MNLLTILVVSAISLTVQAGQISFSHPAIATQDILRADVQGSNLSIVTSQSTYQVPLVTDNDARVAANAINQYKDTNLVCTLADGKKACAGLVVLAYSLGQKMKMDVDRKKLFPQYYKAAETECKINKDYMLYGEVSYEKGVRNHPVAALMTGDLNSRAGGFYVEILNQGRLVGSYGIDLEDVVYLSTTELRNVSVWMKVDKSRMKIVLLEGQSCKAIGEVPYVQ